MPAWASTTAGTTPTVAALEALATQPFHAATAMKVCVFRTVGVSQNVAPTLSSTLLFGPRFRLHSQRLCWGLAGSTAGAMQREGVQRQQPRRRLLRIAVQLRPV